MFLPVKSSSRQVVCTAYESITRMVSVPTMSAVARYLLIGLLASDRRFYNPTVPFEALVILLLSISG